MDYEKKYKEALEHARAEILAFPGLRKTWEEVFPELAESEDDRIRKKIIGVLKLRKEEGKEFFGSEPIDNCIAWLEKQKESLHIPETCKENNDSFTDEQQEQKPVQDETEREYVRTIKSIIADFIRDKKPEDVGYYQQIYDWLDERHIEQKPIDPSDDELQRHQDELYDFKVFAAKQAKEHHISFVHDFEWNNFCEGILSYFNEQNPVEWTDDDEAHMKWLCRIVYNCTVHGELSLAEESELGKWMDKWLNHNPQPKQEWSEEDVRMLQTAIEACKTVAEDYENSNERFYKCKNWLESLRPQPKQEWSEEDNIGWDEAFACVTRAERAAKNEEELQNAVTAEKWLKEIKFKYYVHPVKPVEWSEENETVEMSPYEAEFCQKFCGHTPDYYTSDGWKLIKKDYAEFKEIVMKELKQDWSEEDENTLKYLHELISFGYTEKFFDAQTAADMREWLNARLKSLRPSWKPSEEQMEALQCIINTGDLSYAGQCQSLLDLYNDLKKLM